MTNAEFHDFGMENFAQKFDSCSEAEIDKRLLDMVATRKERDAAVYSVRQEWNLKWTPRGTKVHQLKPATRKNARNGLMSLLTAEFLGNVAPLECNNDFPRDKSHDYFSLQISDMHTYAIDWWQQHRHQFPYLNKRRGAPRDG